MESAPDELPSLPGDLEPPEEGPDAARSRRRAARSRRRLLVGVLIAVLAMAGGGIGAWALLSSPTSTPGGSGSPAGTPARPLFFFRIGDVTADSAGRKGLNVARDASVEIAGQLSSYYDTVFMDPDTWKKGVPDRAWLLFDRSLRARARQDSASLTLGPQAANLESLRVENSSLSVEVLIDARGNPQAAVANVDFKARGSLVNGQPAAITNTASFLLQLEAGEWVVFGYPTAKTSIDVQAPAPSAGISPGSGAATP
ncbi:MAG TPA: hypothetical protein VF986_05185 [Actinomycetota bacterium]